MGWRIFSRNQTGDCFFVIPYCGMTLSPMMELSHACLEEESKVTPFSCRVGIVCGNEESKGDNQKARKLIFPFCCWCGCLKVFEMHDGFPTNIYIYIYAKLGAGGGKEASAKCGARTLFAEWGSAWRLANSLEEGENIVSVFTPVLYLLIDSLSSFPPLVFSFFYSRRLPPWLYASI